MSEKAEPQRYIVEVGFKVTAQSPILTFKDQRLYLLNSGLVVVDVNGNQNPEWYTSVKYVADGGKEVPVNFRIFNLCGDTEVEDPLFWANFNDPLTLGPKSPFSNVSAEDLPIKNYSDRYGDPQYIVKLQPTRTSQVFGGEFPCWTLENKDEPETEADFNLTKGSTSCIMSVAIEVDDPTSPGDPRKRMAFYFDPEIDVGPYS